MKYYKYAVRVEKEVTDRDGRRWHQTLIGLSNDSLADAQREGEARLDKLPLPTQRQSQEFQHPDQYLQYGNRPVAEELPKELRDDHDNWLAY